MSWWEILITVCAALFAIVIIAVGLIKKKKGKTSCCSDCACCPYHEACHSDKTKEKK